MNRQELELKNMKELREIGKEYGVNDKSKEGLIDKILNCSATDEECEEIMDGVVGEVIAQVEGYNHTHTTEEGEHIETAIDITEHKELIESYINKCDSKYKWIKLRYGNIKKKCGTAHVESVIQLAEQIRNLYGVV